MAAKSITKKQSKTRVVKVVEVDENVPEETPTVPSSETVGELEEVVNIAEKKSVSVLPPQLSKNEPTPTPERFNVKEYIKEKAYGIGSSEEEMVPLERSNRKLYFISLFLTIIILSATIAIFLLRVKKVKVEGEITQVVVATSEPIQTIVPDAEEDKDTGLKREEIRLEILNASGISGLAGKTATTFEGLGYKDIKTGNTIVTSGNKIYLNEDMKEKFEVLMEDVEDELEISSVAGEITSEAIDARIILGQ